jgi:hypothetical protein
MLDPSTLRYGVHLIEKEIEKLEGPGQRLYAGMRVATGILDAEARRLETENAIEICTDLNE